jgi:hypothetical protein
VARFGYNFACTGACAKRMTLVQALAAASAAGTSESNKICNRCSAHTVITFEKREER